MLNQTTNAFITSHHISDIIFDFDETLCTIQMDWWRWKEMVEETIKKVEPTFENAFSSHAINDVVRTHGKELRERIVDVCGQAEQRFYQGYTKNDAALLFLKHIAKTQRVHLWTSNDEGTVTPILNELGITKLFTSLVFQNSVMFLKPDPDGFHHIQHNDVSPKKFLFIGDSSADQGAADALGMPFIHVDSIR